MPWQRTALKAPVSSSPNALGDALVQPFKHRLFETSASDSMSNRLLECKGGKNVGGRIAKEGVSEMLEALGQDTQKPAPTSSAKTFC